MSRIHTPVDPIEPVELSASHAFRPPARVSLKGDSTKVGRIVHRFVDPDLSGGERAIQLWVQFDGEELDLAQTPLTPADLEIIS